MSVVREYVNSQPGYEHEYKISFLDLDGKWDLKALIHPRDPWGKSVREHHLYPSGRICVTAGKEPRDFETAEAVALYWMNAFSVYVETGTFPDDGADVEV